MIDAIQKKGRDPMKENHCKSCPEGSGPERESVRRFMRVMKLHRTLLEREFNRTGVYRSQHQILMFLSDHPNATQKEVAERQNVSTATIAVSLKKLEKGGYIRRAADERDNRRNQICLTEKGQEIVADSRRIFGEVERRMFDGFTPEDFAAINECLNRITDNLKRFSLQGEGRTESEE